MKKPPQAVFSLLALGTIRGIIINHKQTGDDTAATFCEILGDNRRKSSGLWASFAPYLDVGADWRSIARVKESARKDAEAWAKFERDNKTELAEYQRLKAKFEGGDTHEKPEEAQS